MDELISIIVPVYNVEKYLNKCLDSIMTQTYKNLEIILVDDGSTDNSGMICDEYSRKDNRIKVIHKANGGVSDARNKGLEIASGDFIGFVDSDDWIDCDMYKFLYEGIKTYNADISICGHYDVCYNEILHITHVKKTIIYNRCEAIEELVNDNTFRCYLWNKLFKKNLFNKIKFPIEFPIVRTNEDKAVMYKLFDQANTIVYLHNVLYFYRKRQGSIYSRPRSFVNIYGNYKAELERYFYLKEKYPTIENFLFRKLIYSSLFFCESAVCCDMEDNNDIKKELTNIKDLYIQNIIRSNISIIHKILILSFICNKKLFKYCFRAYKKLQKLKHFKTYKLYNKKLLED